MQLELFSRRGSLEGEIRYGRDIGKEPSRQYIWSKCVDCRQPRWVTLKRSTPVSNRCFQCGQICGRKMRTYSKGKDVWSWKGGRVVRQGRYVYLLLQPEDAFYKPMADSGGYIREHRLVMAKHLNRCLHKWEFVHHKNGNKQDNRLENLEIITAGQHTIDHSRGYRDGYQKGFTDGILTQVEELKKEIRLLRWQLTKPNEVKNV